MLSLNYSTWRLNNTLVGAKVFVGSWWVTCHTIFGLYKVSETPTFCMCGTRPLQRNRVQGVDSGERMCMLTLCGQHFLLN